MTTRSSQTAAVAPRGGDLATHRQPAELPVEHAPRRPQTFSIFFPMYNELPNIRQLLDQVEAVVPKLGFSDYEILIVDDGSSDGSAEIVEERAQRSPHIRLVRHEQNRGYGAALRTGFQRARHEIVFYTDSDLPVDLHVLADALPLLDNADLVIGYRTERHETLRRALYSRVYNRLMRALFDVRVRDVNFSFKLVRRAALEQIKLSAGTVFIDGQLLAEARRNGLRVVEMPIEYSPRTFGSSSFDSPKVALGTLREMLAYRFQQFWSGR